MDRATYEHEAEQAESEDELPEQLEPHPLSTPWPFCADSFYPIAEDKLDDLPAKIESTSDAWRKRIGQGAVRPQRTIDAPVKHLCETEWGKGLCTAQLGEDVKASLNHIKHKLSAWAAMTKPRKCKFDELWLELPLFFVGHNNEGAAGAYEDRRGLLLLLIDSDGLPRRQVFFAQKCLRPLPGDTVKFENLALSDLTGHVELARPAYITCR